MRIAVVSEASTKEKNPDILKALSTTGHEVINAGMRPESKDSLSYMQTGLLSALLIHSKRADMVVGGCGTGQGYINAVMQYPGMFCGLVLDPVDTWLFGQINGGNCLSLALNRGYGWASDTNLRFMFERLFSVEFGCGFPEHRKEPQRIAREQLSVVSGQTHLPFDTIIDILSDELLLPLLGFEEVQAILDVKSIEDKALREVLSRRLA